jgi:hypothetical protein
LRVFLLNYFVLHTIKFKNEYYLDTSLMEYIEKTDGTTEGE